jgi:hypothetical protein
MQQSRRLSLRVSLWSSLLLNFLVATPAFSEVPISDPVMGRGARWQTSPASATDGRDFLLAWVDGRSDDDGAIYTARVTADGTVLDPEGLRLGAAQRGGTEPSIAWTGDSYVVVWKSEECQYRRIATDGRVIAGGTFFERQCVAPRVASSGGAVLVAAFRPYGGIQVGVLEDAGDVRKLGEVSGHRFSLACSSSDCLLASSMWDHTIAGRWIGPAGERLQSSPFVLATNATDAAVAATAGRFLLAWRERIEWSSTARRIWARELDPQFPPEPAFVVTEAKKASLRELTVAPSGRGFIVAWTQDREAPPVRRNPITRIDSDAHIPSLPQVAFRARRIGDGDEEITFATSSVDPYSDMASVASSGVTHLGTWIERDSRKIAAAIAQYPAAVSRIAVTRTAKGQAESQIVNCGDHLLVIWAEEDAILARRFGFSGDALDVHPIVIAAGVDQRRPAAAFDGRSYLIAWNDDLRVRARVLHRDGTLAPEVHALSIDHTHDEAPSVVATDRGFAVLHGDGVSRLFLTRIGADALLERTLIATVTGPGHALGWNGSELIAVWSGGNEDGLFAMRVASTGSRIDDQPFRIAGSGVDTGAPSMSCRQSECVVAWSESRNGVKIASVTSRASFPIQEPMRDLTEYRERPSERYYPTVVRKAEGFQVLSKDLNGFLFEQTVRDSYASAEKAILFPSNGAATESIVATSEGLAVVESRPVFGPVYAGARRVFLDYLPR